MLAYEHKAYPLPSPKAGEVMAVPLLFEPGTIVENILNNFDGTVSLQIKSPRDDQSGPAVEFCVYFCPPDPDNPGAVLVPQSARLGHGGKVIGQTEGKTHIIIGTKAE